MSRGERRRGERGGGKKEEHKTEEKINRLWHASEVTVKGLHLELTLIGLKEDGEPGAVSERREDLKQRWAAGSWLAGPSNFVLH